MIENLTLGPVLDVDADRPLEAENIETVGDGGRNITLGHPAYGEVEEHGE